jgi:hypothetical protein
MSTKNVSKITPQQTMKAAGGVILGGVLITAISVASPILLPLISTFGVTALYGASILLLGKNMLTLKNKETEEILAVGNTPAPVALASGESKRLQEEPILPKSMFN